MIASQLCDNFDVNQTVKLLNDIRSTSDVDATGRHLCRLIISATPAYSTRRVQLTLLVAVALEPSATGTLVTWTDM